MMSGDREWKKREVESPPIEIESQSSEEEERKQDG
jgi:hypothetical protein